MLQGSVALWAAPVVRQFDVVAAAAPSVPPPVIVSSTGITVLDPPPSSIDVNAMESDTTTWVIAEAECVTLTSDVVVNRASDGAFSGNSNEFAIIPAGTTVSSWIINADRATSGNIVGSITFSNDIVGLIYEAPEFAATTPTFEVVGMTYPSANGAFVEGNDSFILSGSTLDFDLTMGGNWSDVIRVLVAC